MNINPFLIVGLGLSPFILAVIWAVVSVIIELIDSEIFEPQRRTRKIAALKDYGEVHCKHTNAGAAKYVQMLCGKTEATYIPERDKVMKSYDNEGNSYTDTVHFDAYYNIDFIPVGRVIVSVCNRCIENYVSHKIEMAHKEYDQALRKIQDTRKRFVGIFLQKGWKPFVTLLLLGALPSVLILVLEPDNLTALFSYLMFDLFGSGLLATMVGLYHYSKQIGELKHQAKYIKKGTKRDHHDYGESFYKLAKELVISQMHRNGVTEVISEDQPWNWTEPA